VHVNRINTVFTRVPKLPVKFWYVSLTPRCNFKSSDTTNSKVTEPYFIKIVYNVVFFFYEMLTSGCSLPQNSYTEAESNRFVQLKDRCTNEQSETK
jgi:hypothetical protein